MEHEFTKIIKQVLESNFNKDADVIYQISDLIKYINVKTKSANRDSKSRGSYANLYAIYILVEDYINKGYEDINKDYSKYEGAIFSELSSRQRKLPFGEKLQNHALNNRMNCEFEKICSTCEYTPIIRDLTTSRYWINENIIKLNIQNKEYNLARSIIDIIDKYIQYKQTNFNFFIDTCQKIKTISNENVEEIKEFIAGLLDENTDARIFEIVSYAILKSKYQDQKVYFGFDKNNILEKNLNLYKTGRTNANDGGIDFVMKPLGRFFQVTETLDIKKYFLDIDKVEKFPITFVIKSDIKEETLMNILIKGAKKQYVAETIVKKYMECIEEIINIEKIKNILEEEINKNNTRRILDEIILQSKVEFNYNEYIDEE